MPYGVHFFINSGPNTASQANLQLSFPALLSVCNLGFVDRTMCIGIKGFYLFPSLAMIPTLLHYFLLEKETSLNW